MRSPLTPLPRLLIFDVDGTLSDSMGLIVATFEKSLSAHGIPSPGPEVIRNTVGVSLEDGVRRMLPDATEDERARVAASYRSNYSSSPLKTAVFLFEGVRETLTALAERGFWLAVATGKSHRGLLRFLDELELSHHFLATRCADQTRSKPHPQMLEEILEDLGVAAEDAVMIGDTTFDLDMARAAELRSIAVTYGGHPEGLLATSQPTLMIDRFDELLEVFPARDDRIA